MKYFTRPVRIVSIIMFVVAMFMAIASYLMFESQGMFPYGYSFVSLALIIGIYAGVNAFTKN